MNVAQTRTLKAATGAGGTADGPGGAALPLQIRLGWGLGSMPITILNLSSNVLLLRFMTDSLGIAAVVAGLIFAGAKVWDAVTDPLMGVLSDRITTPWGRRLPWLASGGLLCALTVVALYTTPDLNGMALLIYLAAMLLLFRTAYTMFNIPYIAMAVELTPSYHERTQLMSFRVVFSSFGSLIGLSLGPRHAGLVGSNPGRPCQDGLGIGEHRGGVVCSLRYGRFARLRKQLNNCSSRR